MRELNLTSLFRSRNLTQRQKYCIAVTTLYTLGQREKASRLIEKAVKSNNLPPTFFSELFIHLSLFLGFPAMLEGLERLIPLNHSKTRKSQRRNRVRQGNGMRVFRKIYGEQTAKVLSGLNELHGEMTRWVIRDAYGKIFVRPGLSLSERELVNVVVLGIQGFLPQFFSHMRGALRVGVSPRAIVDTLRFIAPFSKIEKRIYLRLFNQIIKSLPARQPIH